MYYKNKRKLLYLPLYFLALVLLLLVLSYLATPRYTYRKIKLHMAKEQVIALEKENCDITPTDNDASSDSLLYNGVPLITGLTADLNYRFTPKGSHPLTSIFVSIPISSDNKDMIVEYLIATFPELKNEANFTLAASKSFDTKSTAISLFPADNSDSYCIHITYKYKFLPW